MKQRHDNERDHRINGGMIEANSVTAEQIDATNLKVAAANITGTLTASQIQTSSIYVGNLADGSSYATKTYVQNNAGLSATEVDDAIATYIDGTSITAESLRGRTVDLLASATRSIGSIELVYTSPQSTTMSATSALSRLPNM